MERAELLKSGQFLAKREFKEKGFLGSGGIARFRNTLWAAVLDSVNVRKLGNEKRAEIAAENRGKIERELSIAP